MYSFSFVFCKKLVLKIFSNLFFVLDFGQRARGECPKSKTPLSYLCGNIFGPAETVLLIIHTWLNSSHLR
jgi:hypothetical protein